MSIRNDVTEFLTGTLGIMPGPSGWNAESALVDDYGLDSAGVFEMILWLEDRFAIRVPPEDMAIEHFATLAAVETYVGKALQCPDSSQ